MSNTKKSLLNENTVRRFMKLAEIDELSDGFVAGLVTEGAHEEEEVEEGMGMRVYGRDDEEEKEKQMKEMDHPMARDDEPEAPAEDDLAMADEPEMADEPAEEPAAGGMDAGALSDAVAQLMSVISGMTGVDIDVDGGEDEAEPAAMDMAPADEEEMALEEEDEVALEEEDDFDQESLVNEITRRVTARLNKESREESVADQLAERIIQRIKEQTSK